MCIRDSLKVYSSYLCGDHFWVFCFCNTECIVMLGSRVIIIGYPPNLTAYDFVLQTFSKWSFPRHFLHVLPLAGHWPKCPIYLTKFITYLSLPWNRPCVLVLGLLLLSLILLILSDSSPFTESAARWVSIFLHFAATSMVRVKFSQGHPTRI